MAVGFRAPLLPLALAVSSAATAGVHGLLAFWMGGAGTDSGVVVPPVVPPATSGGGGLDPGEGGAGYKRKRYQPVKPTGLLHVPRKAKAPVPVEVKKPLDDIDLVVPAAAAKQVFQPIPEMSQHEIHAEIGRLLREELNAQNEDRLKLLLMMAAI